MNLIFIPKETHLIWNVHSMSQLHNNYQESHLNFFLFANSTIFWNLIHFLHFIRLTADYTPEWTDGSISHPLSHTEEMWHSAFSSWQAVHSNDCRFYFRVQWWNHFSSIFAHGWDVISKNIIIYTYALKLGFSPFFSIGRF